MLCLIMLFTIFFGIYIRWCRRMYWQMRMDITAEAVALSAARAQAGMLNNLATLQTAGNVFVPKLSLLDNDFSIMQTSMQTSFELYLETLSGFLHGYVPYVSLVANQVAKANRAENTVLPSPRPQSRLIPHNVTVWYWYGPYPTPVIRTYENVYYVRSWRGDLQNPQPPHQNTWAVMHQGIVGIATARLWLDVSPSDHLANGGFPRLNAPFWQDIGIQCFYPHFNGRLSSTPPATSVLLTQLAKEISHP